MRRRDLMLGVAAASLAAPRLARAADPRSVLRFAPQADLASIDPIQSNAYVSRNHAALVYDTLFGVDENYRPLPQMLEGHTLSDDKLEWVLTLREGLAFHDGQKVRPQDVVASLRRWGQRDTYGQTLFVQVEELAPQGERAVRIRLKRPFRLLPDVLGKPAPQLPVIMQERHAALPTSAQVPEAIGSGPFRFLAGERIPGSRAIYERAPGYVPRQGNTSFWSGPKVAHIDRVEWHTLPDAATAAAALQSGEIDWWEQPPADFLPMLRRNRNIKVEVMDNQGVFGVLRLNHLHPPFDNPAIRRALLGAVNQADFMMAVAGTDTQLWRAGIGYFQPDSPMANDAGMEALTGPRDLDKARAALREAGYKGERVVLAAPTDFPIMNAMSEVAGDMFRKLGFNLDYQALDWATVSQKLNSRAPLDQGGWSINCNFAVGFGMRTPAAHSYLRGAGDAALFGWPRSPRIEELRQQWIDSNDEAEQKRLCREIQLQAFQDVPYIPLGMFQQMTAYRTSLSGVLKGMPLFYNLRKQG
ncbi:ABC transporter substrate-binding protein [Pseudoroseomonas cervicalis]|uniref:ABC transporter substrate-binding protein n=1 Tax=Teichococcus cervicalis TaxID=204525 RepID=UPI0022F17BF1|nr:ABC transporter substrate-binding protein [Pseudoroseomonas cervicalis]WBV45188.1 ABC transporter substrate-binding protein [Pseudoroseomonas cervicalis]